MGFLDNDPNQNNVRRISDDPFGQGANPDPPLLRAIVSGRGLAGYLADQRRTAPPAVAPAPAPAPTSNWNPSQATWNEALGITTAPAASAAAPAPRRAPQSFGLRGVSPHRNPAPAAKTSDPLAGITLQQGGEIGKGNFEPSLTEMIKGERSRTATMGPAPNPLGMSINDYNEFLRQNPQFAGIAANYETARQRAVDTQNQGYFAALDAAEKNSLIEDKLNKVDIPTMLADNAYKRGLIGAAWGRINSDNAMQIAQLKAATDLQKAQIAAGAKGEDTLNKIIAANAGDPAALSSAVTNYQHIQAGDVYTPPVKATWGNGLFGWGHPASGGWQSRDTIVKTGTDSTGRRVGQTIDGRIIPLQ